MVTLGDGNEQTIPTGHLGRGRYRAQTCSGSPLARDNTAQHRHGHSPLVLFNGGLFGQYYIQWARTRAQNGMRRVSIERRIALVMKVETKGRTQTSDLYKGSNYARNQ